VEELMKKQECGALEEDAEEDSSSDIGWVGEKTEIPHLNPA
jgi:hypothetical protein